MVWCPSLCMIKNTMNETKQRNKEKLKKQLQGSPVVDGKYCGGENVGKCTCQLDQ